MHLFVVFSHKFSLQCINSVSEYFSLAFIVSRIQTITYCMSAAADSITRLTNEEHVFAEYPICLPSITMSSIGSAFDPPVVCVNMQPSVRLGWNMPEAQCGSE